MEVRDDEPQPEQDDQTDQDEEEDGCDLGGVQAADLMGLPLDVDLVDP